MGFDQQQSGEIVFGQMRKRRAHVVLRNQLLGVFSGGGEFFVQCFEAGAAECTRAALAFWEPVADDMEGYAEEVSEGIAELPRVILAPDEELEYL